MQHRKHDNVLFCYMLLYYHMTPDPRTQSYCACRGQEAALKSNNVYHAFMALTSANSIHASPQVRMRV
jgi:hypothetical protein